MNWANILERAMWASVASVTASIPVAQVTAAIAGGSIDALQQLAVSAIGAFVGGAFSFLKTVGQERLAILSAARGEHEVE